MLMNVTRMQMPPDNLYVGIAICPNDTSYIQISC